MADQTIQLLLGDCIERMKGLEEGSIEAVVTDPPYLISFMNRVWDSVVNPAEWYVTWLKECHRVLVPGGRIKVFGGTRMKHRMEAAVEQAGFILLDEIGWAYGSGFPKSLSVSKALDKALGRSEDREVVGINPSSRPNSKRRNAGGFDTLKGEDESAGEQVLSLAASPEAARFEGYGTALKPAWEPFVVGMKPYS